MNGPKLKYAKDRLERIYRGSLVYPVGYTLQEKIELWDQGAYTLDFNPQTGSVRALWKGEDKVIAARKERFLSIETKYRQALDQLILGDPKEALRIIEDFSEYIYQKAQDGER